VATAKPTLAVQTYDQLLKLARQRTFEASAGVLNDTSEAGVLSALLKEQSAAIAAQNEVLNSLVDVAVLTMLRSFGIEVSPGSGSLMLVTIVLNQIPSETVRIPRFKIARAGIPFMTVEYLDVPAGVSTVQMTASALVYGIASNVAPGLGVILEPQPLVQSVVFETLVQPGTDPQSLSAIPPQTFIDMLAAGSLTRAIDFEREMRALLGVGSVALAIGKLSADRQTTELGTVHVFGLNPDGTELSAAQIQTLQRSLTDGAPLAEIYVSTIQVVKTQASAIVVLESNAEGQLVANAIWASFKDYVQPHKLPSGEPVYVNQLVVLAGRVLGVDRVQSVSLGDIPGALEPGNHLLPNKWSAPRLEKLTVICVFGSNSTSYEFAI
jgi:hypothetical protein